MKTIAKVLTCTLVLAMVTSIVGAAITQSGSGNVNTKRGVVTNEELKAFFTGNRALLQSIAEQLIPLREETELALIHKNNSQIVAQDGVLGRIDLPVQLMQQLEQYFNVAGTANETSIHVRDTPAVYYEFRLAVDTKKGIMYSTDKETQNNWETGDGCERLDNEWAIYYWMLTAAIVPPWWSRLPAWLQWILRYAFFGWAWM